MNMNKKNILIGSLTFLVSAFVISSPTMFGFCKNIPAWNADGVVVGVRCADTLIPGLTDYAFVFVPIFLFSIITYFLHNSTFLSWRKFTIWWVVVSSFFIFITPSETRGWFMITNPREIIALFSAWGYLFFATLIVAYKSWKLKHSNNVISY